MNSNIDIRTGVDEKGQIDILNAVAVLLNTRGLKAIILYYKGKQIYNI